MKYIKLLGIVICMIHVQHTELLADGKGHDFDSAQVAWIRTIQAGHSSGVDGINAVSTDAQGNVYVTGKSESPDGMRDILTIKYNSLGMKLWSARYDGPAHGFDIPMSLVISADGSVYVLGQSQGTDTVGSYDCVTLKYNASGEQEWVNRFASTGFLNDVPYSLDIDGNGNVYVLASIKAWHYYGNSNSTVVIKYSGSGVEEWVRIEEGPVNGFGETPCLAVDNSGTVFVGGTSPDSIGGKYKLTVASYSTAGDPLWRLRYNVADTTYAQANDIAIDDSGNVLVTGQYSGRIDNSGNSDDWFIDVLTIKCSASGNLLWARYSPHLPNTPSRNSRIVRTDSGGNIYIVGLSGNYGPLTIRGDAIIVIKYTIDGSEVWRNTCGSHASIYLPSTFVASSGNLWVSFSLWEDSTYVLHIDPSGVGTTALTVPAGTGDPLARTHVAVSPNDALYVGSTVGEHNQTEFSLSKYDLAGTPLWNVREDGPGSPSDGSIYAMRLDNDGNIYVAGVCRKGNSDFDFMTAKLNSLGDVQWVRTYDGPAHKNDFCHYLELDGQGNVLVAGASTDWDGQKKYTLIKYGNDGTEQWTRTSEGSYYAYDNAFDLFVDSQGNSYVAGWEGLKVYNQNGDNIRSTSDATYAVAVDASGAIFASENEGIVKYDSSGGQLLIPITEYCGFLNIVLDDSGNVYTSASCYSFGGNGAVAKYAPNGTFAWSAIGGYNLFLDYHGDLYAHTYDLSKFDGETGVREWTAPGWQNGRSAFTIDNLGNAYAADDYGDVGDGFRVRKYNSAGSSRWNMRLSQMDRTRARPYVLATDADGNLYIACDGERADLSKAPTIIKISPFTVGVEEGTGEIPGAFGLSQNYPNPFNPTTEIGFRTVDFGLVTLKVFDVLGREVATLVNEKLDPGTYHRTFDGSSLSSGVYFYRLQAGEFAETRKLMLLK